MCKMNRCKATNKHNNKQCSRKAKASSLFCGIHNKIECILSTATDATVVKKDILNLCDKSIQLVKEELQENIVCDDVKDKIIKLFQENVKRKEIIVDKKHCGGEGHWLETQMGIIHNGKNEPDIFGYEMKKESTKISFGDFSASEYLFSNDKSTIEELNQWEHNIYKITRNDFIKYFGTPNPLKHNRYSWSGKCVPKYGEWNSCGQKLIFNENLDLCAMYSYEYDTRETKVSLPEYLQHEITIAIWKRGKLEKHINNKFNKNGFFICKKIDKTYEKICFGKPFNFIHFVENIKNKNIIFDSGMYRGNTRNYSQFRSSGTAFWNNLIIEEY